MDKATDKAERKRQYGTPRLRVIELVAEEVLAVGCKMVAGSPGPLVGNTTCSTPSQCYVNGS